MKKTSLVIIVILGMIGGGLWRMGKLFSLPLVEQKRAFMDTYVTIYAEGAKKITVPAIDAAFTRMQEAAVKFNAHNPKSPLYAFNTQGRPIRDEEVLKVIRIAQEVSQKTQGAFDITVYPLVKLWGFYSNSPSLPPQAQIKECLDKVGYNHLIFNNGKLAADKEGIGIDLGAIAKGYLISQGIEVLKQKGITSALIEAGGDVYALGKKRGKPWKVGIQHPRKVGLLGYIEVNDTAIMGSGDYQRFFIKEGKRYSHILNPKTGYPVEKVIGVTVIYPDAVLADAWATALCVLEPQVGLKMVKEMRGMEAVIVTSEGQVLYSGGLKQVLKEIR